MLQDRVAVKGSVNNSCLRAYEAYKPSGIEWIGDVPAHWDVVQLGRIGNFSKGKGGTKRDEVGAGIPCVRYGDLYTSHEYHIQATRSFVTETKAAEYTPINYGDILFAGSGETIEEIGKSAVNLMASPACCGGDVILFQPDIEIDASFSGYAIDCPQSQHQKSCMGRGITVMHIYGDELKYLWITLPSLPEQRAIVRYLNNADSRIQRNISTKERLIELLTEQRQAVINQAVTRGLDPNAPLKPSGVEWLGDVPEHWEVLPIKRAFISMDYGISESSSNSGSIRLLTMGNINEGRVAVPQLGGVDSVAESLLLRSGDLLFNRTNSQELVGKVGLFTGHETPVTFASYLVRLRTSPQHRPEYLNTVLNDVAILAIVRREAIPSLHQSNLNPTRYGRIRIPLPPLSEQVAILEYLGKATEDIDASIDRTHRQIELMHEYRTRLIADVVTGKLDVRGVVADEVEIPTP